MGILQAFERPLKAVTGLFRGAESSIAKTMDEAAVQAARKAELLAKGRAIADSVQSKMQAQAAYDAATLEVHPDFRAELVEESFSPAFDHVGLTDLTCFGRAFLCPGELAFHSRLGIEASREEDLLFKSNNRVREDDAAHHSIPH